MGTAGEIFQQSNLSWVQQGRSFNNLIYPGLLTVGGLCIAFKIFKLAPSWDLFVWCRYILKVIFCCFLLSIPWEWFRMYKSELSKKTAASLGGIPSECIPTKMTALNSIILWLITSFSTDPDKCAKYHEAILVDPFWEVSPLMAISACLSRFFAEPLKQLAATSGECFKLFFREIPVQWQPFVFIAVFLLLVVSIISFSGLEISTPLLRIGSTNADASKITTYKEKIASLEATKKSLEAINKSLEARNKSNEEKIASLEATYKSRKSENAKIAKTQKTKTTTGEEKIENILSSTF